MNYAYITALTGITFIIKDYCYNCFLGNIIAFVAGSALTWSSPVASKLSSNETDPAEMPFDHLITEEENSWIGSLLAFGATFGPFLFGYSADRFGRKLTLLSLGCPFLISYLMLAFAKIVPLYYVARILSGLGVGGVFTVMPMYLGEIAEDSNRGALGSVLNCFICAGLFFSYCVGPYLTIMVFNIVLAVFPAVFMVVFYILAPESPTYYVTKGDYESAEQSLNKLRGVTNKNIQNELQEIKSSVENTGKGSFKDLYRSRALLKALIISFALVGFQQLSGINAVLFYTQPIFKASGSSLDPAISSIIIGGVQFSTSFLTPLVADRLGRKPLLYVSAMGMLLSEVPLGLYFYMKADGQNVDAISWLPVVSLVAYIITYNFGFGPLPWAVMGEIFPSNVKSIASSSTAAFCWFLGFIISRFFENLANLMGMGPAFWMFSGFCALAFAFIFFFVIETKGKSLQEIQNDLGS